MKRQPPRGKPSLAPTVDLLRSLEQLAKVLAKWSPSKLALPVIAAVIHETSRNVSFLINSGAPTTAMIHIVRMNEDVNQVILALTSLGAGSTSALEAAGEGRRLDIHKLAKFLEPEGGEVKPKKTKKKSKVSTDRSEESMLPVPISKWMDDFVIKHTPAIPKVRRKPRGMGTCKYDLYDLHSKTPDYKDWTRSNEENQEPRDDDDYDL